MTTDLYVTGAYAERNPTWHTEDSNWKARHIARFLRHALHPDQTTHLVDVGCGAGLVLANIQSYLEAYGMRTTGTGYDIAPEPIQRAKDRYARVNSLSFDCCDVLSMDRLNCDWCLLIDVIEHLEDPIGFLRQLQDRGVRQFLIKVPLENDLRSILRGRTDPRTNTTGHLHFWDTSSAISVLERAGLYIDRWQYLHAIDAGILYHRTLPRLLAYLPRKAFLLAAPRMGAALIGGCDMLATCSAGH